MGRAYCQLSMDERRRIDRMRARKTPIDEIARAIGLPDVVIAHCLKHLAPFKVPRYVQYYRAFPRTGSDKVAKQRLKSGEGEPIGAVFDKLRGDVRSDR